MHLEDLIGFISAFYPDIWAFTGLHFNDDVDYQLGSYFKSRYTIYYQHGSNSFGGVCLAVAREVPRRIASKFHDINKLIVINAFDSNKKYAMAVVYSPPSEEVPIDILNRLHRHNWNLILISDLNARHFNWHDVTSNSCGRRLAEWIDEKRNLRVFNTTQPTSTRSRAIIDLIVAPYQVSTESTVIDQKLCVTDHYPVHWQISPLQSEQNQSRSEQNRLVCTEIYFRSQAELFFYLVQQMRQESIEFILMYQNFLEALQKWCTSYYISQFSLHIDAHARKKIGICFAWWIVTCIKNSSPWRELNCKNSA